MKTFRTEFEQQIEQIKQELVEGTSSHAILALLKNPEFTSKLITAEFLNAVEQMNFDAELHTHPKIATSVAAAFFGKKFEGEAVFTRVAELLGVDPKEIEQYNITPTSGFDATYQMLPGLTEQQYLLLEMLVAQELSSKSVAEFGVEIPDLFLVGTSMPLESFEYFDQHLARSIGVQDLATVPEPYIKACDSSGSAFFDVMSGGYDDLLRQKYSQQLDKGEPVVVTIFTFEDAFRNSNKGGDLYSGQVFSTAGVAWSFLYHPEQKHGAFRKIVGQQMRVREGVECLQYRDTTKGWEREISKEHRAPYLVEPEPGKGMVQMDPAETPLYFRDHGIDLVTQVWEQYKQKMEEEAERLLSKEEVSSKIKRVIVHHPSKTIFKHIQAALVGLKRYRGKGLRFKKEQIQWKITEGNAPSTTIPIAFGRQLEDLDPGDHVLFLSYGAGGSFTCQIVAVNDLITLDHSTSHQAVHHPG